MIRVALAKAFPASRQSPDWSALPHRPAPRCARRVGRAGGTQEFFRLETGPDVSF